MVTRKFVGRNTLLDVLFPYLDSEIKKIIIGYAPSQQSDYNRDTPNIFSALASHGESESS